MFDITFTSENWKYQGWNPVEQFSLELFYNQTYKKVQLYMFAKDKYGRWQCV